MLIAFFNVLPFRLGFFPCRYGNSTQSFITHSRTCFFSYPEHSRQCFLIALNGVCFIAFLHDLLTKIWTTSFPQLVQMDNFLSPTRPKFILFLNLRPTCPLSCPTITLFLLYFLNNSLVWTTWTTLFSFSLPNQKKTRPSCPTF